MGFHNMVSEILIRRSREYSPFSEVRSQIPVGLRDGIKVSLGKVAKGDIAAPGRYVAVINTGHHHRSRDNVSASGGKDEIYQHRATMNCRLAPNNMGLSSLVSPVASPQRDSRKLGQDDSPLRWQ